MLLSATSLSAMTGHALACLVLSFILLFASNVFALTPARTVIQNQSTAAYHWSGRDYDIASNAVRNLVAPIYGLRIVPDGTVAEPGQTAYGDPGRTIYFPYVLTNTGNIVDSYDLSVVFLQGSFLPSYRAIYLDANGNGRVDAGENAVKRIDSLGSGDFVNLLVRIDVPANALSGTRSTAEVYHDLQGRSAGHSSVVDKDNVNRILLVYDAVLKITKSPAVISVAPGGQIDFALDVINVGSVVAQPETVLVDGVSRKGVLVRDQLAGAAEGLVQYVPGTLTASPTGRRLVRLIGENNWRELTSANEAELAARVAEIGILFDQNPELFVPSQQARVKFRLAIAENHPAGLLPNTSRVQYRSRQGDPREDLATNTVRVTVQAKVNQVLIGPYNEPAALGDVFGELNNNGDVTLDPGVPAVAPNPHGVQVVGNTVYFLNTIRNDANATDTINVSIDALSNLPASWLPLVSVLAIGGLKPRLEADGVTPFLDPFTGAPLYAPTSVSTLFDSNGDGIPDTGPLAPGASRTIAVRMIIPKDALEANQPYGDNNGQGYRVTLRAQSTLDPSKSNLTSNTILRIMASGNFWDPFIKAQEAPGVITIGTTIPYVNIFGNNGPGPVFNTVIRDELSEHLTNVQNITNGVVYDSRGSGKTITVTGHYDASVHEVVWHIFEIPPRFVGRIGFSADVASSAKDGTEIPNIFSIISDQTQTVRLSNQVVAAVGGHNVLTIDKKVSTDKVDMGDPLRYEVKVHNKMSEPLRAAEVIDLLPKGFRYLAGSATVDGEKIEPEISSNGLSLQWNLGTLAPNSSVTIVYACVVTTGARPGRRTNRASVSAIMPMGSYLKADTSADVEVEVGIFHNDSIIFGRVFVDQNDDKLQNYAEPGIQGVRLILEDGTYVLTDREGKYHFSGIKPGMRVLRLDETTLPPGMRPAVVDSQNALNPLSRMVELRYGTPHKANFRVLPVKKEGAAGAVAAPAGAAAAPAAGAAVAPAGAAAAPAGAAAAPAAGAAAAPAGAAVAPAGAAVAPAGAAVAPAAGAAAAPAAGAAVTPAAGAAVAEILNPIRVSMEGAASLVKIECAAPAVGAGEAPSSAAALAAGTEVSVDEASGIVHIMLPGVRSSEQPDRVALDDPNIASLRCYLDDAEGRAKVQVRLRKRTSGYPSVSHALTDNGVVITVGAPDRAPDLDPMPLTKKAAPAPSLHEFDPLILSPEPDDTFTSSGQITVKTAFFLAGQPTLYINGEAVPQDRVGQRSVDITTRRMSLLYYGVNLIPGVNTLRLEVLNPGENAPRVTEVKVLRSAAPVKIELEVTPKSLMADSLTEPQLRIALFDDKGVLTGHGSVVTVSVDKGDILSPDLRVTEPGHQAQVRDGMALIRLSAASTPETRSIRVIAGDLDQTVKVVFKPHQRPWIVSGIVSGTVTDAHTRESKREGGIELERKIETENRVAWFAKGSLPYDMVLTTSYDSRKPRDDGQIFSEQDLEKYYPVYGDESEQQYEAESRDKLYVKVEKDQSYVMYGDFETDMDKAELAAYQRSMTGAKAHIESTYVDVDAFFSHNDQIQIKGLEIRGRGVSGYYTLPDKNIIYNSERVVIETRDRWHPDQVIKSESKTRFTDYSIDYDTGRILFKRPIPSKDKDNNPVYIVVDYEVDGRKSKDYNSYGGRAELHNAARTMAIGVTHIRDESAPKDHVIDGVDASVQLIPGLTLSGEYAQSSSFDGSDGSAMRVELEGEYDAARYRLYYRNIGNDFDNQNMAGDRAGRMTLGFEGEFDLNEHWSTKEEFYTETDREADRRRHVAIHDFIYKKDTRELTLGLGYTEEEDISRTARKGERLRSPFVRVGAGFNLSQSLRLDLFHQQAFGDSGTDQSTRSTAELRYTLNRYADLVLSGERRDVPNSGYEYNASLGIEAKIDESTSAFNRLKLENSASGKRVSSGSGLDISHQVSSEWKLGGTAELSHSVRKSKKASDEDFWAFTLSTEYRPLSGAGTAVARYEMRDEDTETSYLTEIGGTLKLGIDYTLFGRNIVNFINAKDEESDQLSLDLLLGCAYRPVNWDTLNVIGDIELKHEKDTDVADYGRLNRLIFSIEGNWQPCKWLTLEAKYACKNTDAEYLDSALFSDVKALAARVDITERLFVSVGARVLSQYDVSTHSLSYGGSIGFNVRKDLQLAFGYNFEGFEDRDFSRGAHWEKGFFVALHWKFDESIFGVLRRLEGEDKP